MNTTTDSQSYASLILAKRALWLVVDEAVAAFSFAGPIGRGYDDAMAFRYILLDGGVSWCFQISFDQS